MADITQVGINLGEKHVKRITLGGREIAEVRLGSKLVWPTPQLKILDWVEADGQSPIDTGYIANDSTYIKTGFALMSDYDDMSQSVNIYYDTLDPEMSQCRLSLMDNHTFLRSAVHQSGTICNQVDLPIEVGRRVDGFSEKGHAKYKNTESSLIDVQNGAESGSTIKLLDYDGEAVIRIYYINIIENNTREMNIIHNYLPAQVGDDKVGLYDTVDQKFFKLADIQR